MSDRNSASVPRTPPRETETARLAQANGTTDYLAHEQESADLRRADQAADRAKASFLLTLKPGRVWSEQTRRECLAAPRSFFSAATHL